MEHYFLLPGRQTRKQQGERHYYCVLFSLTYYITNSRSLCNLMISVSDVECNVINKNALDTARMSQMMNILIISYICHSLFPELDPQSLLTRSDQRDVRLILIARST